MYAGVVVTYNPNQKEILDNISSYINDIDVLYVVDNSQNDNSLMFENINKVEYIPNMENMGIAYALNVGAKKAIEHGYKWLLTMDQDSSFRKDALKILEQYIETYREKNVGIYSPLHLIPSTENSLKEGISNPLIVMTSGNIVNLEAYETIGGFPEWYFIDCVDFDFCLNLRRHNYEIVQVNSSVLNHELGETISKKLFGKTYFVDNHNYIRRYYIVRNRHYFYDRFINDFPSQCEAELKCTKSEAKRIILFEKDKIRKLFYMYKGYRDYKKGIVGKINLKNK